MADNKELNEELLDEVNGGLALRADEKNSIEEAFFRIAKTTKTAEVVGGANGKKVAKAMIR